MRSILRIWRAGHPRLVRAATWLALLGVLLLGLGIWIDLRGLWVEYPFTTNVLSTAGTSMTGVPIAIIVLSELTARSTRYRASQDLQNLLRSTSAR